MSRLGPEGYISRSWIRDQSIEAGRRRRMKEAEDAKQAAEKEKSQTKENENNERGTSENAGDHAG